MAEKAEAMIMAMSTARRPVQNRLAYGRSTANGKAPRIENHMTGLRPTRSPPAPPAICPATPENHAILGCPWGTTTNAANNAPDAEPMSPPTWNRDWASPYRPPAAMRATREASGWKIAEPIPINVAASRIAGYVEARDINRRPTRVRPMPTIREYGRG